MTRATAPARFTERQKEASHLAPLYRREEVLRISCLVYPGTASQPPRVFGSRPTGVVEKARALHGKERDMELKV